ncbi:MAG: hypothetical protein ABI587_01725 [Gemmatimonadales bacterium]
MSSHRTRTSLITLLLALPACGRSDAAAGHPADSSFAAMKARGAGVMGVNQDASEHVFEDLPDGGRIAYRMLDATDTNGVAVIRRHLRSISDSFSVGVFHGPTEVHGMEVPGSVTMTRLRGGIQYAVQELPTGAELRISSADSVAIEAIHAFLAFQRIDHRAAGHDQMHQP